MAVPAHCTTSVGQRIQGSLLRPGASLHHENPCLQHQIAMSGSEPPRTVTCCRRCFQPCKPHAIEFEPGQLPRTEFRGLEGSPVRAAREPRTSGTGCRRAAIRFTATIRPDAVHHALKIYQLVKFMMSFRLIPTLRPRTRRCARCDAPRFRDPRCEPNRGGIAERQSDDARQEDGASRNPAAAFNAAILCCSASLGIYTRGTVSRPFPGVPMRHLGGKFARFIGHTIGAGTNSTPGSDVPRPWLCS